jgi:uncharacterized small protein (DUF1192 family)
VDVTTKAATKLPPLKPGEFRFVTKALSIEPEADGKRRFHTIASSTVKDLGNDEMRITALEDMAVSFRRGLNIFMNHSYKVPEDVFGRSDSAEIRDSGERAKSGATIWDLHIGGVVNDPNPRASQLADSMEGGYVTFGTSVGAIVKAHQRNKDGGLDIEHVDCKEGSIVGIPMNQRSWTQKAATAAQALDDSGSGLAEEDDDTEPSETVVEAETAKSVDPLSAEDAKVVSEALAELAVAKGMCAACDHAAGCDCATCPCDQGHGAHAGGDTSDPTIDGKSADSALDADDATIKGTTEGGQEADPAATPETAPDDTDGSDPAIEQKAIEYESSDVVELVRKTARLVEMVGERDETIAALRDELATVKAERDRLDSENKEASVAIERVMSLPLRPRAQGHIVDLRKRLPDFLAPEVADFLNKTAAGDSE